MASRPFATALIEIERNVDSTVVLRKDITDIRKRKKVWNNSTPCVILHYQMIKFVTMITLSFESVIIYSRLQKHIEANYDRER